MRFIAQVLTKHGLGHFVDRIKLRRYLPLPGRAAPAAAPEPDVDHLTSIGDRIVRVCEDLGPAFVKIGQLASSRPDLVPAPIVKALTRLQDQVAPFDFEQARGALETDLGAPLDELYAEFDRTPFASGSMAQVHNAV
ncbi:MAG: AarF/UbiB family protein, partial [Phycisphaerae bacterium]